MGQGAAAAEGLLAGAIDLAAAEHGADAVDDLGGGLLTICQGQKSYKKGQLLPVDLARLNRGKNPSHSQNGS